MRPGVGLEIEQSQRLVMTPELRQAIAVLQLSSLELADYLEQALLDNPLLEIREEAEQEPEEGPEPTAEEEWLEYFADGSDLGYTDLARREKQNSAETFLSDLPTLHDHLLEQLYTVKVTRRQRAIGEFLIGNVDDNGYLRIGVEEAARCLGAGPGEVFQVLRLIQSFDPPGVGARNLTECLLLQLEQLGQKQPLAEAVVRHHLASVAAGHYGRVARCLGVGLKEVQEIVDLIRTLDPKPGRRFGSSRHLRYVQPDVIVERVGGDYVVMVNDAAAPRLTLNPVYQSLLKQGDKLDPATRDFLESRLNAALWLLRSLEQRRLTLYRVASYIVEFQREFLDKGIKFLKPLTLRRVAQALGVHESTVSRATSNKYLQTPRGLFEFRFFFAHPAGTEGREISAETVKRLIQEHIASEDPARPLSDQQIADRLRREGIAVARRTVAKYRDELGIPAAPKRRRYG